MYFSQFLTVYCWFKFNFTPFSNVRPLEEAAADALRQAEKEAEATKMALKRKIEQAATSDFQVRSLPAKLRIDPNDPEDVVSDNSFLTPRYL
jgi:hypothetical protein